MKRNISFALLVMLMLTALQCGDSKSDSDAGPGTGTDSQGGNDAGIDAGQGTETGTETESESTPERPAYTPPEDTGDGLSDAGDELSDAGQAACFHTESCLDPIPYERQICQFPLTPTLDGNLDEGVWQSAIWSSVDSTMGPNPADNDVDGSFEFACVADSQFLYIAFRVQDDILISGESSECEVWGDDSIEFYIDGCYEREADYNGDEAQITIGADTIGITDQSVNVLGGCAGDFTGEATGTQVYNVAAPGGWAGEIAIPLQPVPPEGVPGWNIQPVEGQIIGFNAHYNDDDDGGDRDHKLIWSMNDRYDDASWQDTQMFGELQFCPVGAVDTDAVVDTETDTTADTATLPDAGVDAGFDAGTVGSIDSGV